MALQLALMWNQTKEVSCVGSGAGSNFLHRKTKTLSHLLQGTKTLSHLLQGSTQTTHKGYTCVAATEHSKRYNILGFTLTTSGRAAGKLGCCFLGCGAPGRDGMVTYTVHGMDDACEGAYMYGT